MLENGAFHKWQNLIITENIALLFIPPYYPELNPAEKNMAKNETYIFWKVAYNP